MRKTVLRARNGAYPQSSLRPSIGSAALDRREIAKDLVVGRPRRSVSSNGAAVT